MGNKIFIVDDDPGIRDILKIIFERAGYDVTAEANVDRILQDDYTLPDIFLLDRFLSGVDGLEICRYLKSNLYSMNVPVLMVSASPDIGVMSISAGADGFIEKPFNMKELLSKVEAIINAKNYIAK